MAVTPRNSLSVNCPGCGGTFLVPAELSGRRGKCTRCGSVLAIPGVPKPSPPPEPKPSPKPQLIHVACRVCQTPLYGTEEQIGRELKCPDCGGRTQLRAPKPVRKNIPAAMEGEQYELWDADDAPLPSEMAADAAEQFPVPCWLCETLMYATPEQVGQNMTCPDCGSQTPVVAPAPKPRPREVLTEDGTDYAVDETKSPGRRPPTISAARERQALESEAAGRGKSTHDYRQRRPKTRRDARGRPIMPRFPLLVGVLPFLWSEGAPGRWLGLSMAALFVGGLAVFSLSLVGGVAPQGAGGIPPDAAQAVLGVCFLAGTVILSIVFLMALAANMLAIVVESSEGNDEVAGWPPIEAGEWLAEFGYLLLAVLFSAFPGWVIARFATDEPLEATAWIVGGILLSLPIVVLSQLQASSAANVISGSILASIARVPLSWILFYVESLLLVSLAVGAVVALVATAGPTMIAWVLPCLVALLFVYARLLGRLGWRIAEAMPVVEDSSE